MDVLSSERCEPNKRQKDEHVTLKNTGQGNIPASSSPCVLEMPGRHIWRPLMIKHHLGLMRSTNAVALVETWPGHCGLAEVG